MNVEANNRRRAMPFHISAISSLIILVLFIGIIFNHALGERRVILTSMIECVINILAITALYMASIKSIKRSRRAAISWGFFATAQLSLLLADVTYFIYEGFLGISITSSPLSSLYLFYYPLFMVGILLMPLKSPIFLERQKRFLDSAIVMTAAIMCYLNFLIGPLLIKSAGGDIMQLVLSVGLPVGDLILLALVLSLPRRITDKHDGIAIIFLMFSATLTIIGDAILGYQMLKGNYFSGGLLEVLWLAVYMLAGLAGLLQISSIATDSKSGPPQVIINSIKNITNSVLPYFPFVWLIGVFLMLVRSHYDPTLIPFVPTMAGVAFILLLLIARQIITHIENNRFNTQLKQALEKVQIQTFELSKTNQDLQLEIGERKRAEEQLSYDALHDWLTGLPNRTLFLDRLGQAIEYTQRRPGLPFSVLFIDLDHFKIVNDSLGHHIGDKLLIAVAKRLVDCLRTSDTVARLGGDEFVILLENTKDEDSASRVINRIQEMLKLSFPLEGNDVYITASIGVVMNVQGYSNTEDVLRDADIAMYHAKTMGKARAEVFDASLRSEAISRLELENDLRHALEHDEFCLYYQPILSIQTSHLTGFEALIRWQHPHRGLIAPAEFIPVAEESGLIIPIGKWVMLEACTQIKKWQQEIPEGQDITVNVNISGKQFAQADFIEQVEQTLLITGLKASSLKLEITESVLIQNQEPANKIFDKLCSLGIQLEIDDFGTGYSSLGYLQHFPIHMIKIDKSFIQEMRDGGKGSEIIRAMITMARDLGMNTIAEGIETKEQLEELQTLMCEFGQGYLLSRPMDSTLAENYLKGREFSPIAQLAVERV
jgi:diguanylate cyclase (GGDEF)-like protein